VPAPLVAIDPGLPAATADGGLRPIGCPIAGSAIKTNNRRAVRSAFIMISDGGSDVVVHHHVVALQAGCDIVWNVDCKRHRSLGKEGLTEITVVHPNHLATRVIKPASTCAMFAVCPLWLTRTPFRILRPRHLWRCSDFPPR